MTQFYSGWQAIYGAEKHGRGALLTWRQRQQAVKVWAMRCGFSLSPCSSTCAALGGENSCCDLETRSPNPSTWRKTIEASISRTLYLGHDQIKLNTALKPFVILRAHARTRGVLLALGRTISWGSSVEVLHYRGRDRTVRRDEDRLSEPIPYAVMISRVESLEYSSR